MCVRKTGLERKVQKRTGEEEVEELDLKDCRIQEEEVRDQETRLRA